MTVGVSKLLPSWTQGILWVAPLQIQGQYLLQNLLIGQVTLTAVDFKEIFFQFPLADKTLRSNWHLVYPFY
jgi:hypothetical protein